MTHNLQIEKAIVFFDIESTGVNPSRDRIVELAVIKLLPGGETQKTVRRINPEMEIPAGATAIHGISNEDVKDCPTFAVIAEKLYKYLENCDLAGYNIVGFDIPMLECEFRRVGFDFNVNDRKIIDVYNIFCKLYPRNLTAAYKFFCNKDLEGAHGAMADTMATYEVLLGQFAKHEELPKNMGELSQFCDLTGPDTLDRTRRFKWMDNEVIVNFGKNSGRTLKDLSINDPGFLRWIIRSDFADDVKSIASNALLGKFPTRKGTNSSESTKN